MLSSKQMGPERTASHEELRGLIRQARKTLRRALLAQGTAILLTGGALTFLLGAAAGGAGLSTRWAGLIELALLVTVTVLVLRWARTRFRTEVNDEATVAGWIDQAIQAREPRPAHAVAVRSAFEMDRDRGRFGESPSLSDAAVASARARISTIKVRQAVRRHSYRRATRWLLPLLASAAGVLALALWAPQHLRRSWGALRMVGLDHSLQNRPPEPRLGDFHLSYHFPAYAERPPISLDSPTGDIRALPGTEVIIETQAEQPIVQATLLLSYGEGHTSQPERIAVEAQGRRLRARLVVSRKGRYRFLLKTADDAQLEERRGHDIQLELDDPPEITLLAPKESPLEVNEDDRVTFSYQAEDDFALGEVTFVWRVMDASREGRVPFHSATRGKRTYAGQAPLELSKLELKPGDRIAYYLEVQDNDTVNGPKLGASETRELRVYSKKAHHQEVLALQERSLDELVHILGDNLESQFQPTSNLTRYKTLLDTSTRIVTRARTADGLLRKTVAAIRKDPHGRPQIAEAFEQARVQLSRTSQKKRRALSRVRQGLRQTKRPDAHRAKTVARTQAKMVSSLEKNVVYLSDLLHDQHLMDAESLAKELREEQKALKEALEAYKNAPNEEKRKQIAESIQDIKRRVQETMRELAKLQKSIPQDFVNSDALKVRDTQNNMDEINRMIEEGDLNSAMESLEQMLAQTENMLAELQGGRQELGKREYSEITQMADQLWQNLTDLEQEQQRLAKQTEQVSKKVLERMESQLDSADTFVAKQIERLESAKKDLKGVRPGTHSSESERYEHTEQRIEDGIRALKVKDFGAAEEMVQHADQQMERLQKDAKRRSQYARRFGEAFGGRGSAERLEKALDGAKPQLEAVLKDLKDIMPTPQSVLNDKERRTLERHQKEQAKLKKKASELQQQLNKLSEQLPMVSPEIKSMAQESGEAMGQAEQSLGKGDAPSALNQERRALDALKQMQKQLQEMGQGGGGGSPMGGGVPLPFGKPGGGQRGKGGRHGGRDPRAMDKVEIPKPEQYKAPAEFREDILEAAKQGTVEAYRDAVRRYYQELVK